MEDDEKRCSCTQRGTVKLERIGIIMFVGLVLIHVIPKWHNYESQTVVTGLLVTCFLHVDYTMVSFV